MKLEWTQECGERLRGLQKDKGMTMGELARKASTTVAKLSHWEHGRTDLPLSKADALNLSIALEVRVPFLYCETDDPQGAWPEEKKEDRPRPSDVFFAEKQREYDQEAAEKVDAYVRQERRDKFARAALTGLLSQLKATEHGPMGHQLLAGMAWKIADAMIADEP